VNNAHGYVGVGYRLLPEGLTLSSPVAMAFHCGDDDNFGGSEDALGVAFENSDHCRERVSNPMIHRTSNSVAIDASHFSGWTLAKLFRNQPAEASVIVDHTFALSLKDCCRAQVEKHNNAIFPGVSCGSMEASKEQNVHNGEDDRATLWSAGDWAVNGIQVGNDKVSTISTDDPHHAAYQAPSTPPDTCPLAVSANVATGATKTAVVANVNVVNKEVYNGAVAGWNYDYGTRTVTGGGYITWTLAEKIGTMKVYRPRGKTTATYSFPGCAPLTTTRLMNAEDYPTYGLTVLDRTPIPEPGRFGSSGTCNMNFFIDIDNVGTLAFKCGGHTEIHDIGYGISTLGRTAGTRRITRNALRRCKSVGWPLFMH
jgi:hypothetical protein